MGRQGGMHDLEADKAKDCNVLSLFPPKESNDVTSCVISRKESTIGQSETEKQVLNIESELSKTSSIGKGEVEASHDENNRTVEDASYPPDDETDGMIHNRDYPTNGDSYQGEAHMDTLPGAFDVPGWRPGTTVDAEDMSESSASTSIGHAENEIVNAQVLTDQVNLFHEIRERRGRIVIAHVDSVEDRPILPSSYYFSGDKRRMLAFAGFFFLALMGVIIAFSVKGKRGDKPQPVPKPIETQPTDSNLSLSATTCIPDGDSLRMAIDAYLDDNSSETDVAIKYGWPIGTWCVSLVIDFDSIFDASQNSRAATFNEALNEWDVSNGKEFTQMFFQASNFNQDLSKWNLSSATTLSYMFFRASSFNQSLSTWDVSSVVDMSFMFGQAKDFNGNLSAWNVSKVHRMNSMFANAASFNNDISGWQVSNVVDMSVMFESASNFNQNIGQWNTSSLSTASSMFRWAAQFNQDISGWSMSQVTSTESMFEQAKSFNQDISEWNLSSIENPKDMFLGASVFRQDLCAWGAYFVAITKNSTDSMLVGTNCSDQIAELSQEPFDFCEPCTDK